MRNLITIIFAALVSTASHASPLEKYPVSPLAWEVQVERVGKILFRYVRFLSESEYPCLRLETFDPEAQLKLLYREDICKVKINNQTIDVRKDVSGAFFEHLRLQDKEFNFALDIILRRPGSHYLNCKVVIAESGKLSEPICKEGARPPEQ